MKVNVLFISSNYPPRVGGPSSTVPQIAKSLSKKMSVSVVAFRENGVKNFEEDSFRLYRSPAFYHFSFNNPLSVTIRTILMSFYSKKIALNEKPKIIHAHDTHISAISALFVKFTSIHRPKVITKYAGDLTLEFSGLSKGKEISMEEIIKNPSIKQKILFSLQKIIFNLSDYIQVQNNYQKKILKSIYSISDKKIFVLPNPVDFQKFNQKSNPNKNKLSSKKDSLNLLMVSRIVPWKGHKTMLLSMPKIIEKYPDAFLKIIGEGSEEYVASLKELAKEMKIEKNIKFIGKIANNQLPSYYASSDLFIQPSSYEPFGITILEALACKTPVIGAKTGGIPELIDENKNGMLFSPGNHDELAKKVILGKKIFKNDNFSDETIKKYELDNITNILEKFYLSISIIEN